VDVCTLIVATTMTLQLCTRVDCRPTADGTKQLCQTYSSCAAVRYPTYECKRPDGSTYTFEDKTFEGNTVAVSN
jgi:hypothetical protein